MKTTALSIAVVSIVLLVASDRPEGRLTEQSAAGNKLALVGGMLLDGYEAPPIHHAAVLIEGDRIVRVGRAAEITIPPDYVVVDTSGRTMMPGMIDLHAHLIILGHGTYGRWFSWVERQGPTMLSRVMEISARQLLMAGVTSAVDLGAPLDESLSVRDRINRGEIPGPRMSMSGPWVTRSVGGMTTQFGGVSIASSAEAAQQTERLIAAGVDVIKAHGGLTREDYGAIAGVARKHNVRVHAHVYDEQDVRNALEMGIDVLTHAGSAGSAPPYSAELIRDIVNAGRPVAITAAHRTWIYPDTAAFPERLQDPQLRKDFPPEVHSEVQESLADWRSLGYFQTTPRQILFRERGLKQFIEAGAVMGMGTDSGTPMNFHTEALWREAKAHVEMGMPPMAVISALTRVGARILGQQQHVGSIESGKLADIIVVKGNPLYDILALSHVEVVVKGGRVQKGAQ